jgi:hypothetical protein
MVQVQVQGGERAEESSGTRLSAAGTIGWKHLDRRPIYTSSERLLGFHVRCRDLMSTNLQKSDPKIYPFGSCVYPGTDRDGF